MDVALQKHGAKHVYHVPEGLRELCADISREVLRAQPTHIYCFIADYIDALLITRENAKVAVKVVNNIILGSESVVYILQQSGLSLEQIALAATRVQKAFRSYLDIVDVRKAGLQEAKKIDENTRICIREILESTGTTWEQAENAATTIQNAFRSHYKEMLAREARGEIQWQRAVINTIAILRKAGVSQEEAAKAATLIQSSYRGYYIRRNIRLKILTGAEGDAKGNKEALDPRETIQAVAWMDMMFQDSGHTRERANEAATIIQSAYRGYRDRVRHPSRERPSKAGSSQSMVVEAILDNLRQRVWGRLKSIDTFPDEIGSREEMIETVDRIESEYKKKRRKIRINEEFEEYDAQHIEEPPVVAEKNSTEVDDSREDEEEGEEEYDEALSDSNLADDSDAIVKENIDAMEPEIEAPAETEDLEAAPQAENQGIQEENEDRQD